MQQLQRLEFRGRRDVPVATQELERFGLAGRREYTQKEVADAMGISQSYISRLEKRILQRLRRDIQRAMSV